MDQHAHYATHSAQKPSGGSHGLQRTKIIDDKYVKKNKIPQLTKTQKK